MWLPKPKPKTGFGLSQIRKTGFTEGTRFWKPYCHYIVWSLYAPNSIAVYRTVHNNIECCKILKKTDSQLRSRSRPIDLLIFLPKTKLLTYIMGYSFFLKWSKVLNMNCAPIYTRLFCMTLHNCGLTLHKQIHKILIFHAQGLVNQFLRLKSKMVWYCDGCHKAHLSIN